MGFLAPAALLGLGLLAIPIAIHLLKPRQVRRTPFTSLRWLKASEHRLSRRIRWHQLLLFFLRAGLITCLVLAVARPYLALDRSPQPIDRIVVLDVSRSMGYALEDGKTVLEGAKRIAAELLERGGPDLRATLLVAGNQPTALGPLVRDATRYLGRLRSVTVSQSDVDVTRALRLVPHLVDPGAGRRTQLVFITDNQTNTWNPEEIHRLRERIKGPLEATVVRIGPTDNANALIADAKLVRSARARKIRVQITAVGTGPATRTVTLASLSGLPTATRTVRLRAGAPSEVDFDLPRDFQPAGQVAQLELHPGDALASDDRYWLNLDRATATRVLVIAEKTSQIEELQSAYPLRVALESLADAAPGTLDVALRTPEVPAAEIRRAEAIVLVDVPRLATPQVEALRAQIEAGAGLAVFLGPSIDRAFYNDVLGGEAAGSLLGLSIGQSHTLPRTAGHLLPLATVRWDRPLFGRLGDPVYSDLAQVGFRSFYRLQIPRGGGEPLAWIADQAPAVVEHRYGAGKVVVLNTTASDAWSDLSRHASFVPLMDRMLAELAPSGARGTFAVGEPIQIAAAAATGGYRLETPRGNVLATEARAVGERRMLRLPPMAEQGVYQLKTGGSPPTATPLVVQARGEDSYLEPLADESLRAWWKGAELEIVDGAAGLPPRFLEAGSFALTPWMVTLACLLLLAEMLLVHYVCPRRNPEVATQARFRPSSEGEIEADRPTSQQYTEAHV